MFKVLVLVFFLLFLYFILKNEKPLIKWPIILYFTVISIVFLVGIFRIESDYQLYHGPVLEGGFQSLMEWVSVFSYLYILPTLLIAAYIFGKLVRKLFVNEKVKIVMYVLLVVMLSVIGFLSFFIFTLLFYGFAP